MSISADIAIVGAGMAGASLAAAIGGAARVVLIEAEEQPGYHATGRSAAFWSETYGGPAIQPLTTASGGFLEANGFLRPRGALTIATAGDERRLDTLAAEFAGSGVHLVRLDRAGLDAAVVGLRPQWVAGLAEPSCRDIDVAALHAYYLASARRAGAEIINDARVSNIARNGATWALETRSGKVHAPVLVNAAGAWASEIAAMAGAQPIAITPYRRTMVQLAVDPPASTTAPLIMDAAGSFYFKPEAGGRVWLSPHDETATPPCDAAPEEIDIAYAIDRFERAINWRVLRREHAWAGLRSFSPDRAPVYGFDTSVAGFFWFAGQGGFGIQTAPAAADIGAALILGKAMPATLATLDLDRYAPRRFSRG